MKTYVILAHGSTSVPIDVMTETASDEISSLLEQGFEILEDNLQARSVNEALEKVSRVSSEAKNTRCHHDNVVVSTNNSINGMSGEYVGVVFSEKIRTIGAFTLYSANEKLSELRSKAIDELKQKAYRLGADAITGLQVQISTNTGTIGIMSALGGDPKGDVLGCVSVSGTAVKLR